MKPAWSVIAVLPRDEDVLAVARHFVPQDLNLPGGKGSDDDIDPAASLRRIVQEQTGIKVEGWRLITDRLVGFFGEPLYCFFVTRWTGKPRSSTSGKALWCDPERLVSDSSTFWKTNKFLLRKIARG